MVLRKNNRVLMDISNTDNGFTFLKKQYKL